MKNLKIALLFALSTLMFASCLNSSFDDIKKADDLTIPSNFLFATTQTVNMNVAVNDTYSGKYFYKVEIFDNNPFSTDTVSSLISAGVANATLPYATSIAVPSHVTNLYIRETDPTQNQTVKVVSLSDANGTVKCDFGAMTDVPQVASVAQKCASKVVAVDPKASDYALPASYTTLGSAAVTLDGTNYLVPAGTVNSSISFGWKSNSALYVAGEVNFQSNFYMPGNCTLVVLPGGKVTFNTTAAFEQAGDVIAIQKNGTLTFNNGGGVGYNSLLVNDGSFAINAAYEIRSNGRMVNNGTITGTQLTMTNNTQFTNNGSVTLSSAFVMNSNTAFTNNGPFVATGTFRTNNTTAVITNNNHIKTNYLNMSEGGGTLINNCSVETEDLAMEGSTVTCAAGTLVACQDVYLNNTTITLNGDAMWRARNTIGNVSNAVSSGVQYNYGVVINGVPSGTKKPLVEVWKLREKNSWMVLKLNGTMEYSLEVGNTPGAHYYNGVSNGVSFVEKPTMVVASTGCNGGGVNADKVPPTPSDPTFPIVVKEDNQYTFAMEDLWPFLGDYDMNDIVYRINNITKTMTAANTVSAMTFDITPLAAGSTKGIAAAVQFDKLAAGSFTLSSTYSGAYIESGQEKANILLFPEVHKLFGKEPTMVTNAYMSAPKITCPTYTFTITFKTPVDAANVTIDNMNFYSIVGDVNTSDRHEIHLAGRAHSSKVTTDPKNYIDSNNMVWGIMVPTPSYHYPTEGTKIYNAYPLFNTWATSGGSKSADWYLHPSPTSGLIYTK